MKQQTTIAVHWAGYSYTICHDGKRYIAICSKGHDKKRMDRLPEIVKRLTELDRKVA